MIIIKGKKVINEKERLDEMGIRVISSLKEGLPFRITIQNPDREKVDHAHVRDLKTGNIKLGAFAVSKTPPKSPRDIKDYQEGISDEMRNLIFEWSKCRNWRYPGTNWQALQYECDINRNG